jgi:hypothetical protein
VALLIAPRAVRYSGNTGAAMPEDDNVYGEVNSVSGLRNIFLEIRRDVDKARSRDRLTELHRRAGYLITLTYSSSWEERFGRKAASLRRAGQEEFARTARKINRQAKKIGTDADYDETWGKRRAA